MKKIIIFILCLCMVLCGCGSAKAETTPSEIIAATAVEIADIVETSLPSSDPAIIPVVSGDTTIPETIVFDNGDFKLTAKEIDFSDDYDVKVKFLAENNSDSDITINGDYFSVNGITMYCDFYIQVAAGKKANDHLKIDKDDLASYGITDIATIKAQDAYIYNQDTSKKIIDFRFELSTSQVGKIIQEIDRSGHTVYNQNGITVKYRGIVPGKFRGEELEFFVENTSDANIGVYVDDVSVNGFMVYGNMVAYAYPGCVTYTTMDLSSSDLEYNDIETIEEVSLVLYGYDQDARKKVWETEEFTVGRNGIISLSTTETPPEESEPVKATEAATETEPPKSNSASMESVVAVLESTLKENYNFSSVTYEGSTIDISISYPGLASELKKVISSNDTKQLEAWNSVIASFKKVTSSALYIAHDAGFEDATVILNLRNDLNPENILLIIMNDTVIYDVVNSK